MTRSSRAGPDPFELEHRVEALGHARHAEHAPGKLSDPKVWVEPDRIGQRMLPFG